MADLHLAVDLIRRRFVVVALTIVAGLVAVGLLVRVVPRTYEASARVLIVNESQGRDPSVSSIDLPSVATSTAVLGRVKDELKLPLTLIDLKRGVKARVTARSSIMEIAYRDASQDRAVAVPNAIAGELSRYYDEIARSRGDRNVRKLDEAIEAERARLAAFNVRLAEAAAAEPFLDSDKSLETITARLDDLQMQRQLAGAVLEADGAAAQAVAGRSQTLSAVARHEILAGDDVYRGLAAGTAKDQAQLEFDRASYTSRYPGLQGLEAKVQAERASVRAAARRALASPEAFSASRAATALETAKANALVKGDRAKVAALDDLIATQRQRLDKLPEAASTAGLLKVQRDAAQANFLALSSRRATAVANRAEALSLGSVVVVDRAVRADAAVVGLSRGLLAVMTALVVVGLAFGSAFLVEMLDTRLRRPVQIERLYGAPFITLLDSKG